MSWLFGAVNVPTSVLNEARGLIHQTPLLLVEDVSSGFCIAAGGLGATCPHSPLSTKDSGWVVSGIGIRSGLKECHVYNTSDWNEALKVHELDRTTIQGHFVIVRWDGQGVHCYTDTLGVRTLYFSRVDNGVVFSTRLDWLAKLTRAQEIDYRVFGSQWLTFNQLSDDCLLYDLERLPAGGYLYANRTGYTRTSSSPWSPSWKEARVEEFISTLQAFAAPRFPESMQTTLGLSGGLDSRLLLAASQNPLPAVHTFGPASLPDVQIASAIAGDLSLNHRIIYEPVPDEAECLRLLNEQVIQNNAITSASACLGLRYFGLLNDAGLAMIDGGFGEIARRQFLNRLLIRGKNYLEKEDFEAAFPLLYTPRPSLFNLGTQRAMREGALDQFINRWHSLPHHSEIGFANKLDLFSIRTRLPNFFGFEQNRLDGYVLNYMPFAQIPVLETTLGLPIPKRKNGRLFRALIRKMHRSLTRYPLAKGSARVAFNMNPLISSGLLKLQKKVSPKQDPQQHLFLQRIQSFALERLHSRDVREYEAYDFQVIKERVTAYYRGQTQHAAFVDWWLAFDVWRHQISKPFGNS